MHVTALAPLQRQPFFRHSLGTPVDGPIRRSVHLRVRGRSTQWRVVSLSRSAEAERCFPSHSPTLRPWIAYSASYVEELWSPSLVRSPEKEQAKAHAYSPALFQAPSAEGLSLSGGASIQTR